MAKRVMLNKWLMGGINRNDVPQPVEDVAKPIGDVVKISGEGTQLKKHYKAFEFGGETYEIGDTVLLAPDSQGQMIKPYATMIKDITETESKEIILNAQWFYRPEDVAPRKDKKSLGTRELYYSFHKDKVPAETVMHKCIVHFITEQKHIPTRKEYPGFIVHKLYNPNSKRLSTLTTNSFLHDAQHEIDKLVQKTMRHLNILPDIESTDHQADHEDV